MQRNLRSETMSAYQPDYLVERRARFGLQRSQTVSWLDDDSRGRFVRPKNHTYDTYDPSCPLPNDRFGSSIDPPHKNLIAAIIGRALADLTDSPGELTRYQINEARRWLFSKDISEWSFIWCCGILSLDWSVIQTQVKNGKIINIHDDGRRFEPKTSQKRSGQTNDLSA